VKEVYALPKDLGLMFSFQTQTQVGVKAPKPPL
jgi:hypothetical protein